MNKKHSIVRRIRSPFIGLLAFTIAGNSGLWGQDNSDEVYELSPFSISADENEGYRALNTLAGTRLRTPLKDIAGAVQVVTEEFLEDQGVANVEDLFLYTTNTEVSGPEGNFGAGGGDRRDPNGRTRVRGLAEPDRTRNFFLSDIGLDTYNTDRVAIAKGPNALLFGLGSPAGLYNSNLKQAHFEEETEIKLRYGSWGAHREIIDANRVLVDDVLSLRIIGLNNQTKYKQKPSFEDEQRLFGALLYKPTDRTTIRVNAEIGSRDASRPPIITPTSNIPDWIEAGMPTNSDPTTGTGFGNMPGNRGPAYVFENPDSTVATVGFDAGPATPGPDGKLRRMYTWKNREDSASANVSNAVLSDEDSWVFDFRNNTVTGTENTSYNSFDATNLVIEQIISENAGVELAFDKQNFRSGWLDRASNAVNVATSEYMNYFLEVEDDGTPVPVPNPNVGRPYRHGWDNFANSKSMRDAMRLTAYYDLDLRDTDSFGYLGRHLFTGVFSNQSREIHEQSDGYGIVSGGEIERILEANRNRGYSTASYDRGARNFRFLGQKINGRPSSGTIATRTTANTPRIQQNTAIFYDSTATPIYEGHKGAYRQVSAPLVLDTINNASIDRQEIESFALSAQSYLFNDNIVATYGWRKDKAENWRDDSPEYTSEAIALPETLGFGPVPDNSITGDVFTWGVVGHLPEEWSIPGVGISAHYGISENFVPSPGRITILNDMHPDPAGETTEYGFSIDLPEQNFYVRFNWFETVSSAQTDNSMGNGSIPNYERLWYNGVRSSLQEKLPRDSTVPPEVYNTWDAKDPRLWPNNIGWETVYTVPPLGMREVHWTPVDPGPGAGTAVSVSDKRNPNMVGVSDFSSEGMEIEGVWNPTENWTFMFNAAQQKAIKTNVLKSWVKYFDIREPQWLKMGDLLSRPNTFQSDNPMTIYRQTRQTQWSRLLKQTLREGALLSEVREWRFNLATAYHFSQDSILAGWAVGGGYRWQDDVGVGFANAILSDDPRMPVGLDEIAVADVTQPLFGPSEENMDLWIRHSRKILDDKVDWRIQLNVRNVLDNDDLIVTAMDGDGLPSRIRIMNPMNFRLTSTFNF